MEETKEVKTEEKETEKKSFKQKAAEKRNNVLGKVFGFIGQNPMLVIPLISIFTGLLGGGVRAIAKAGRGNYDECFVEDDVTGLDYLTVHPLNNSEILELSERKSNGETTGEALLSMGMLRNEKSRK